MTEKLWLKGYFNGSKPIVYQNICYWISAAEKKILIIDI